MNFQGDGCQSRGSLKLYLVVVFPRVSWLGPGDYGLVSKRKRFDDEGEGVDPIIFFTSGSPKE